MADKKSIGLPGGPNEFLQDITQYISVEGYKSYSPDITNPINIIESGSITMEDVDFPVHGIDNLGNEQIMFPENNYQFPGDMVMETPMLAKSGRELPKAQWGVFFKKLPAIGKELGKNADELLEYFSKNIDEFKKWWSGDNVEEASIQLKNYADEINTNVANTPKKLPFNQEGQIIPQQHMVNTNRGEFALTEALDEIYSGNPMWFAPVGDTRYFDNSLGAYGKIDEGIPFIPGQGRPIIRTINNEVGNTGKVGFNEFPLTEAEKATKINKGYNSKLVDGEWVIDYNDPIMRTELITRPGHQSKIEGIFSPDTKFKIFKSDLSKGNHAMHHKWTDAELKAIRDEGFDVIQLVDENGNQIENILLNDSKFKPTKINEMDVLIDNPPFAYGGPVAGNITHNKTTGLTIPTPLARSGEELPKAQWGQIGKNLAKLFAKSADDVVSNAKFVSEIDWSKWNKSIVENKALLQEYNLIEETTKANNTWMKNADGTDFIGTPEQFIQSKSSNFKKAYPDGVGITYRGNMGKFFPQNRGSIFTGDRTGAIHYGEDNILKNILSREQGIHELYYPKSNNTLLVDLTNHGQRDWKNLPIVDDLGRKIPENEWVNEYGEIISNVGRNRRTTDDIARYLEDGEIDYATLRNLFDGTHFEEEIIYNQQPGRFLKSMVGNDGSFNLDIIDPYRKEGGESKSLPKAQFGPNSIMSGNAYGVRPAGSRGVLGDIYDATGVSDVVENEDGSWDWLMGSDDTGGTGGAMISNILDILSIPGSLMAEGVEYFGERGDKEFNFSDAMPGFSGDFSFTNWNDEPIKTVSQTTNDDGEKLVENFWGGLGLDILTDPSTWVGAGLIKHGVTKGPKVVSKVLPKVSGKTDEIVEAVTKQSKQVVDDVVDASNKGFKSEIDWSKWNKDIPNNRALMDEYTEIERLAKADGTWMKNADGSPFTLPDGSPGTAEQFVQMNSQNFKNAYPKGIDVTYRGADQHNPVGLRDNIPNSASQAGGNKSDLGTAIFTADQNLATLYSPNHLSKLDEIPLYNAEHFYKQGFPFFTSGQPVGSKIALTAADDGGIYKLAIPKVDDAQNLKFNAGGKDWTNLDEPYIWDMMSPELQKAANANKFSNTIMYNPNRVHRPKFSTDDVAKLVEELGINRSTINNLYDFGKGDILIHNNKSGNYAKSLFGNDGSFNLANPNIYKSVAPLTIGGYSLSQQQEGPGTDRGIDWKNLDINLDGLKKGISQAESSGGVLMLNPKSTATGLYGQRFSEIEDGGLYDGTRIEFSEDIDAQNKLFELRLNEGIKINETTPLLKDAWDLTQEYKDQLGDDWNYSYEDIIGLSNFLGRKGARKFFGNVIRDGKPLAEVYPNLYGEDVEVPNKTPQEYLEIIREFYADGGEKIHTVSKGENLSKIARQYNTSVDDIVSANDIPNPSLISIDQELVIPAGIIPPSGPTYKVKKGDTLNEIAKSHNTSWHTLARLNDLTDPNLIIAGQDLMLPDTYRKEKPLAEEKWISVDELKKNNEEINSLTDENIIVKSQMINDPNQRYVLIDKQNQKLKLYHGDEIITEFEVATGANTGDAQTVTVPQDTDGDGKITEADKVDGIWQVDWNKGNLSTGAGRYTISNQSPTSSDYYNNAPSFNLVNEAGIEVSTAIHGAPDYRLKYFDNDDIVDNRSSNGCINGKCSDLQGLYDMGLPNGTPVFVLPEDEGNRFEMVDGKAVLRMNANNRAKYQTYEADGESRKGQGGNYSTNTLSYKPIRAQFDEAGFRDEIFTAFDFNDDEELNNTTIPFISALVENKKDIMKEAQISSDVYNQIAKMAFGIYGAESNFGDTHSGLGNFMRAGNKYMRQQAGWEDGSSPDVKSKHDFYGLDEDYRSVGYTQMRWSQLNEREKKALGNMNIRNNADLLNPEKAAIATALVLGIRYHEQLSSDQKKNMWLYLPSKWNKRDNYVQRVKHNSRFLNFEQFDRMTAGGEVENLAIYRNYISGTYDNTKMEDIGVKIYDKLNRKHYKQAKELGMSPANYVMTYVINDS